MGTDSIVVRCDVCLDEMAGVEFPRGWTQVKGEDGRWRDRCVDCSTPAPVVDDSFASWSGLLRSIAASHA